jgi:hypothetical protein
MVKVNAHSRKTRFGLVLVNRHNRILRRAAKKDSHQPSHERELLKLEGREAFFNAYNTPRYELVEQRGIPIGIRPQRNWNRTPVHRLKVVDYNYPELE